MADSQKPVQIPSTAVMANLVAGVILTWLGLMQCAIEFVTRQLNFHGAISDVTDSVAFGLGFVTLAWILWVKPWVGGILLTIAGLAIALWINNDWDSPKNIADWVVRALISIIPIVMGVFTVTFESRKKLQN
ncbi:MAG: hypothetical protein NTY09_13675 [bacterium]|nr:hypothetical protein [bacterium]